MEHPSQPRELTNTDNPYVRNLSLKTSTGGRLGWLDVMRILTILMIVGFHWIRTCEEYPAFGLTPKMGYEAPGVGFHQLYYLFADKSAPSISFFLNNIINFFVAYGWEAVNVFVLLSGLGLAMNYRPYRADFTFKSWYKRRFERILLPYYLVAIPLILVSAVVEWIGNDAGGVLGRMAGKLSEKNLHDPVLVVLIRNIFMVDPTQRLWITDLFSPAWWFIPPILCAYVLFPLLYKCLVKLGPWVVVPISLLISSFFYLLSDHFRLLLQHGWYFIFGHELCTFMIGIILGRYMSTEEGKAKMLEFLSSPSSLVIGGILYALGNIANWFDQTYSFSTPIFALGLAAILGYLGVKLAKVPVVLNLCGRVDGYHLYLLHQFPAFPLVAIVLALSGSHARSIGYSLGFAVYIVLVYVLAFFFEIAWKRIMPGRIPLKP